MKRTRRLSPAALASVALLGCHGRATSVPDAAPVVTAERRAPVFVHLFEWRWPDVARECETSLGPAGFAAVQISPPSEHAVLPGAPWWERYQTVGYSVEKSRGGTGEEFRDMVRRCAAAGVGITVDAVINHMTAQARGIGSNGTAYTKYEYPGLYAPTDFHAPACAIAGSDYQDAPDRVRNCELLGLADLDTGSDTVRARLAGYLTAMVDLGVRGFRIDAAKHIDPVDLDAIVDAVPTKPSFFYEVIDHGGEAIRATDYLTTGQAAAGAVDVTEFKYDVADAFRGVGGQTLAGLRTLGGGDAAAGVIPSDRAVVFGNNHDTQRGSSLFYGDGAAYDLATVFMLTWPYGHPSLLSSYAFDRATAAGRDVGPPDAPPDCTVPAPFTATQGWLCEHRRPYVARLLAFREAVAAAPEITDWWDDGANQIAFGRGGLGFVVLNNDATALHRTFTTSLPVGAYCDLYEGGPTATGCSGARVDVDADGNADLTVAPRSALVLQKDPR
jgi:alpha-amylase